MKKYLLTIIIIFFICFNLSAQTDNIKDLKPRYRTVINLDKDIETQKIPAKIIFNGSSFRGIDTNKEFQKESSIGVILNIAEGPDSTLYALDYQKKRIVQLSQDGKYIKSFGEFGKGPGKFIEPQGIKNIQNKYLYVSDPRAMLIQVFDLNGNYLRTIKDLLIPGNKFSIGKNGMIFTLPREASACTLPPIKKDIGKKSKTLTIPKLADKFLILVLDSLGKEMGKIGAVKGDDPDVFQNNRWPSYYILTHENTDYIWCVFQSIPLIKKYDMEGNFIEEIKIESKYLDSIINRKKYNDEKIKKLIESDKAFAKKYKNLFKRTSTEKNDRPRMIELFFINPIILPDGDLVINFQNYGNIQISGKDNPSRVVKKYEFTRISEEAHFYPASLNLCNIHGKIYGYDVRTIVREDK